MSSHQKTQRDEDHSAPARCTICNTNFSNTKDLWDHQCSKVREQASRGKVWSDKEKEWNPGE